MNVMRNVCSSFVNYNFYNRFVILLKKIECHARKNNTSNNCNTHFTQQMSVRYEKSYSDRNRIHSNTQSLYDISNTFFACIYNSIN